MKVLENLFKKNTYNPVVWDGDVDYLKLAKQVKRELDEKENKRKEHYMDFLKNIVDKIDQSDQDSDIWLDYMIDLNLNILYIKNIHSKKILRIERVTKPIADVKMHNNTVVVHVTNINDPAHVVLLEIYVPSANIDDTFDTISFLLD